MPYLRNHEDDGHDVYEFEKSRSKTRSMSSIIVPERLLKFTITPAMTISQMKSSTSDPRSK